MSPVTGIRPAEHLYISGFHNLLNDPHALEVCSATKSFESLVIAAVLEMHRVAEDCTEPASNSRTGCCKSCLKKQLTVVSMFSSSHKNSLSHVEYVTNRFDLI